MCEFYPDSYYPIDFTRLTCILKCDQPRVFSEDLTCKIFLIKVASMKLEIGKKLRHLITIYNNSNIFFPRNALFYQNLGLIVSINENVE